MNFRVTLLWVLQCFGLAPLSDFLKLVEKEKQLKEQVNTFGDTIKEYRLVAGELKGELAVALKDKEFVVKRIEELSHMTELRLSEKDDILKELVSLKTKISENRIEDHPEYGRIIADFTKKYEDAKKSFNDDLQDLKRKNSTLKGQLTKLQKKISIG